MDLLVKVLATAWLMQSDVESAIRVPRLSVAERSPNNYFYNNVEGAYSFNYDISDSATGNSQYRTEERFPNGTVTGAYGYVDAFGSPQRFRYIADQAGYRVFKENRIQPFYGPTTTVKPIDKGAVEPTEGSITWSRPKRPNKNKNKHNISPNNGLVKYNYGNRRYNLIGPPSLYAPYF